MTSKKRISVANSHQQPDRVPVDINFADELEKKLLQRLGFDDRDQLFEFFGQDTYMINPDFPGRVSDVREFPLESGCPAKSSSHPLRPPVVRTTVPATLRADHHRGQSA